MLAFVTGSPTFQIGKCTSIQVHVVLKNCNLLQVEIQQNLLKSSVLKSNNKVQCVNVLHYTVN